MLSLLRLEHKQKNYSNPFWICLFFSFSLIWNWNDKRIHTLLQFPQKPYLIPDQNGQSVHPFSDQRGAKTPPDGAAHTYMAYIRKSPPGRGVLPYMGYIGMCRCEGYGFQAVILFYNRVSFFRKLISWLKISIGNSMKCSDIWHKYHEWYFKIV